MTRQRIHIGVGIMFPLPTAGRIGLYVLLLLAAIVALHFAHRVVVPLLFALLLATVLGPAASWLHEKMKIRWALACVVVIFGLVMANLLIFFTFSASVSRLVTGLSDEEKNVNTYKNIRTNLEKISPVPLDPEFFPAEPKRMKDIPVFTYIQDSAGPIFREVAFYSADWVWQVVLVLFTTFFVLLEGRMLARRVVAVFGPSSEVQEKAKEVLLEMATQVRTYLVWRTIINLGLAVVLGVFFQVMGLKQAWTWAILLAILNYIPYFGPVLASIPPLLDALTLDNPVVPIVITVVYWVVILIEGWLIVPLLMGPSMDLNATTVMLACLFWPLVWGPTGLFLAMPLMAAIKAVLHSMPEFRPWADLMSASEPEHKPELPTDMPKGQSNGQPSDTHITAAK
jgi:predicted PurR-regulated permease PerM